MKLKEVGGCSLRFKLLHHLLRQNFFLRHDTNWKVYIYIDSFIYIWECVLGLKLSDSIFRILGWRDWGGKVSSKEIVVKLGDEKMQGFRKSCHVSRSCEHCSQATAIGSFDGIISTWFISKSNNPISFRDSYHFLSCLLRYLKRKSISFPIFRLSVFPIVAEIRVSICAKIRVFDWFNFHAFWLTSSNRLCFMSFSDQMSRCGANHR